MTTRSIHSLTSRYGTAAHNATSLLNQSRLSHIASGEDYIGYNENNNSLNHLLIEAHTNPQLRYWAFVLILFPLMTIIGNILVVISVFREKYLQTCTNFFVVSLALSDLIVASCVMPLAVYYEITQKWHFSNFMCDLWVSMDVMGSTASILNLVSIAIDRYIAVKYPIKYAQHKSSNRIYLTIAFVWILSIMIALPMLLGMNETKNRNPDECAFNNDTFLLYSSVFSFYLPTLLMIMLYYKIFRKIRSRAKSQSQKLVPVKKDKAQDKIKNASGKNLNNENDGLINKNNGEGGKQKIKETRISIKKSTKSLNPMNIMSSASKKEKRITKTLAIVLIVYLVCW